MKTITKLITVTSIRPGTGKTTVSSILAEMIIKNHKVLLVDNNKLNISIYNTDESSIENIKLYMCLDDKENCRHAIKESAVEIKKNLFFFSGSQDLLSEKELIFLKNINIFDYVIVDTSEQYFNEFIDLIITVINPNTQEYIESQKYKELNKITLINKYSKKIEFKTIKEDFKLYFCEEIINFTNGYELNLQNENKKEVERLIEKITEEPNINNKHKFRLFKRS